MEQQLTHFDASGNAVMVDVSGKAVTSRTAVAQGSILVNEAVRRAVQDGTVQKGDVLGVARVAGIMASKRTADLVPLCHPIALTRVELDLEPHDDPPSVHCRARAETVGPTGVEMEALTAVQVALLTVYDMCKAVDRGMTLTDIRLLEKSGGKSGTWRRPPAETP